MDCDGLSAIIPHNYRPMSLTEITHAEDGVDVPDVIAEKETAKAGESTHEAEVGAIVSILFSPHWRAGDHDGVCSIFYSKIMSQQKGEDMPP
jgi:hypothetical protein